jgi:lipopolysaccharide/colanic/teichoic acid biosynthesis glycosyltransferase
VIPALLAISPLLLIIAIAVRLSSRGPVIFQQQRAGRDRKLFTIYKFRTMSKNSELIGPDHTTKDDPRITPIGNLLRRFKLDELPQLYNVVRGDMSLVGPRPKLAHHDYTPMVCRPGITGAATLAFRNEQRILCKIPPTRLEFFYQTYVIPKKLRLDAEYMSQATLLKDMKILFATILSICNLPFLSGEQVFSHLFNGSQRSQSTVVLRN